jgi:TPP-dependent pyruvate/acetoin dehydrogenase alpha subunit
MNRAQETKPAVQVEVLVHWYEQMQTIRAFDECVVDLFNQGAFGGSTHPSIAQEAIAVGACAAL